jgi:hypothetical protein
MEQARKQYISLSSIKSFEWNGIKSCPGFTVREGQTLGEAARLSQCDCEFCRMARDKVEDAVFVTKSGERVPFNFYWHGLRNCPGFTVFEGQTFADAARHSGCTCELCRKCRMGGRLGGLRAEVSPSISYIP